VNDARQVNVINILRKFEPANDWQVSQDQDRAIRQILGKMRSDRQSPRGMAEPEAVVAVH
jgi:hypothetical protein